MSTKKSQAIRGAYLLAAMVIREEVKKLRKLSLRGVALDADQHTTLVHLAEELHLLGISEAEPPAKILLVDR